MLQSYGKLHTYALIVAKLLQATHVCHTISKLLQATYTCHICRELLQAPDETSVCPVGGR